MVGSTRLRLQASCANCVANLGNQNALSPPLRLFADFLATFEKPLGYRRAPTGGIHEARDKAWSSAAEL
jgi:hypothetical protein